METRSGGALEECLATPLCHNEAFQAYLTSLGSLKSPGGQAAVEHLQPYLASLLATTSNVHETGLGPDAATLGSLWDAGGLAATRSHADDGERRAESVSRAVASSWHLYNRATILFHTRQFHASMVLAEAIFRKIDCCDDWLGAKLGFLLLELLLYGLDGLVSDDDLHALPRIALLDRVFDYFQRPHAFNGFVAIQPLFRCRADSLSIGGSHRHHQHANYERSAGVGHAHTHEGSVSPVTSRAPPPHGPHVARGEERTQAARGGDAYHANGGIPSGGSHTDSAGPESFAARPRVSGGGRPSQGGSESSSARHVTTAESARRSISFLLDFFSARARCVLALFDAHGVLQAARPKRGGEGARDSLPEYSLADFVMGVHSEECSEGGDREAVLQAVARDIYAARHCAGALALCTLHAAATATASSGSNLPASTGAESVTDDVVWGELVAALALQEVPLHPVGLPGGQFDETLNNSSVGGSEPMQESSTLPSTEVLAAYPAHLLSVWARLTCLRGHVAQAAELGRALTLQATVGTSPYAPGSAIAGNVIAAHLALEAGDTTSVTRELARALAVASALGAEPWDSKWTCVEDGAPLLVPHNCAMHLTAQLGMNLGLQLLEQGRPDAALDAFALAAWLYRHRPRFWLRVAEACVLAHSAHLEVQCTPQFMKLMPTEPGAPVDKYIVTMHSGDVVTGTNFNAGFGSGVGGCGTTSSPKTLLLALRALQHALFLAPSTQALTQRSEASAASARAKMATLGELLAASTVAVHSSSGSGSEGGDVSTGARSAALLHELLVPPDTAFDPVELAAVLRGNTGGGVATALAQAATPHAAGEPEAGGRGGGKGATPLQQHRRASLTSLASRSSAGSVRTGPPAPTTPQLPPRLPPTAGVQDREGAGVGARDATGSPHAAGGLSIAHPASSVHVTTPTTTLPAMYFGDADVALVRWLSTLHLHQAILSNLAYVHLCLGDPCAALHAASALLELPHCDEVQRFNAHMYAAEALATIGRPNEALTHILPHLLSGGSGEGVSTMVPAPGTDTGVGATQQRRVTLLVNLAVTHGINGDKKQMIDCATQALKEVQAWSAATPSSAPTKSDSLSGMSPTSVAHSAHSPANQSSQQGGFHLPTGLSSLDETRAAATLLSAYVTLVA